MTRLAMLCSVWLMLAAAPTAAEATQLADSARWAELEASFSELNPTSYAGAERGFIASALARGCEALLTDDALRAFALGEKANDFKASADSTLCAGAAAANGHFIDEAKRVFRRGLARYPKDPRFALALSGLTPPPPPPEPRATAVSSVSGVDASGRRTRANRYFVFRYFSAQRDFGQRADYEGRIEQALDAARRAAERLLGVSRERPTDVILYSRTEFAQQHGVEASLAIAGFYRSDAIHLNDSADFTGRTQTTLVHEYVHAVVDELSGFSRSVPIWLNEGLAEYTAWRFEGREKPEGRGGTALKQLALRHALPRVAQLNQSPLIAQRNPALAYAHAALAVKALVHARGMHEVIELIRDCAQDTFEHAWARRFGMTFDEFDEEVEREASRE